MLSAKDDLVLKRSLLLAAADDSVFLTEPDFYYFNT